MPIERVHADIDPASDDVTPERISWIAGSRGVLAATERWRPLTRDELAARRIQDAALKAPAVDPQTTVVSTPRPHPVTEVSREGRG